MNILVAQPAEAVGLSPIKYEFESHRGYIFLVVSSNWKDRRFLLFKLGFDSLHDYALEKNIMKKSRVVQLEGQKITNLQIGVRIPAWLQLEK